MEKYNIKHFIEKAQIIHGKKFDYSLVEYINAKTNIIIICPFHGNFTQTPDKHLHGQGCKKCVKHHSSNFETFVSKANTIHDFKYKYPINNYKKAIIKIEIECSIHGIFYQEPSNHLAGHGCSKCAGNTLNTFGFIEKSIIRHNNLYDYSNVKYINSTTKVEIICKKHGIFLQNPSSHMSGVGCPKCKLSKAEIIIKNYLDTNKIAHTPQHTFNDCINPKTNRKLIFDFYLPNHNLCIEYNGEQHYNPFRFKNKTKAQDKLERIKHRDLLKINYCIKNKLSLLIISYKDFNNIAKILQKL